LTELHCSDQPFVTIYIDVATNPYPPAFALVKKRKEKIELRKGT
jgi:hypothetical protein